VTDRLQPLAGWGGAYTDESRPFSMQDAVNCRFQRTEKPGTRFPDKMQCLPGLRPFVEATDSDNDPVRGTHNAEGKLVAVIGRTAYRERNGVLIPLGTLPGTSRVSIDHNQISLGNEVTFVNGSAGYTWNSVTDTFARIDDPGYPGGSITRFLSGYMVGIEPQGRYAYNSLPAQAREFNTLDRWTSEVSPDRLVTAEVRGEELLLLSTTSGEFFQATANARQPFRSKRASFRNVGASSAHGIARTDGNVWWWGGGKFYCLNGYSPFRKSLRPIEDAVAGLDHSRVFCFVWDTVVYSTFPDGQTWGYDFAQDEWHRRESYGLSRWRANTMTEWGGGFIAGDFQRGRLWHCNLSDRYWLEGDQEYVVRRTLPVIHDHDNPVHVNRLRLTMDTGGEPTVPESFPAQPAGPTITGNGLDGVLGVAYLAQYTISGGTPPYTAQLRSGGIEGVELGDVDGTTLDYAGTPTSSGEKAWTLRVRDANQLWVDHDDEAVIAPGFWLYGPTKVGNVSGGAETVFLRTIDPTDWAGATELPIPSPLPAISRLSAANGKLYAHPASEAYNARVSSNGGVTWTECSHPLYTSGYAPGPVWHNGDFYYWRGLRSADGVTFSAIPNLPAVTIERAFGRESDGLYLIAATNGNIYTTLDNGANWTTRTNPFTGAGFYPFASDGDRIAGAASGGIGYGFSDDEFATAATASGTGPAIGTFVGNGVWIGQRFNLMRSTDGATYEQVLDVADAVVPALQPGAYGDGVFVWAEKTQPAVSVMHHSDDDGETWETGDTIHGTGGYLVFMGGLDV
jgi:hypothetical protein